MLENARYFLSALIQSQAAFAGIIFTVFLVVMQVQGKAYVDILLQKLKKDGTVKITLIASGADFILNQVLLLYAGEGEIWKCIYPGLLLAGIVAFGCFLTAAGRVIFEYLDRKRFMEKLETEEILEILARSAYLTDYDSINTGFQLLRKPPFLRTLLQQLKKQEEKIRKEILPLFARYNILDGLEKLALLCKELSEEYSPEKTGQEALNSLRGILLQSFITCISINFFRPLNHIIIGLEILLRKPFLVKREDREKEKEENLRWKIKIARELVKIWEIAKINEKQLTVLRQAPILAVVLQRSKRLLEREREIIEVEDFRWLAHRPDLEDALENCIKEFKAVNIEVNRELKKLLNAEETGS